MAIAITRLGPFFLHSLVEVALETSGQQRED